MVCKQSFSKNVELLAYHDLKGNTGCQMAMQEIKGKYYLYIAAMHNSGWTILDVTVPDKPRYVKFFPGPALKGQNTLKIQIADGLMIGSLSGQTPLFHGNDWNDPYEEGIIIYDVKDPENPKFLSHWKTGGRGVHRFFYGGGRYVHLSAACPGFGELIYRAVDVSDPTKPVEAGRWWLPEQWLAGATEKKRAEVGSEEGLDNAGLHGPPYPKGNYLYCGYGGAGMVILDISDISVPKLVGHLRVRPPIGGGLAGNRFHTILPLSQQPVGVFTTEGERYQLFNKEIIKGRAQPMNVVGIVDIADPANPTLIATCPYPEVPEGYPFKNFTEIGDIVGPFGPHNLHEPGYRPALEDRNDRIYCAYFHAGLRVYDISDRFVPKEIAYYIPPDGEKWAWNNKAGNLFPGPNIATTEDVIVDNRGVIYMDMFQTGLYILKCTV
jgi:hypothetical protein